MAREAVTGYGMEEGSSAFKEAEGVTEGLVFAAFRV